MDAAKVLHHIFSDARSRFQAFVDPALAALSPELKKVGEMVAANATDAIAKHLEQLALAKGADPATAEAVGQAAKVVVTDVSKAAAAKKEKAGSVKVTPAPAPTPITTPAP